MPIEPTEILSRYIFTTKYFRSDNSPKPQAFEPRNNQTSVFRTSKLTESENWDIGKEVGSASGRSLKGRADLLVSSVLDVSLNVIESIPPPLHANIVGWPQDEAETKQLALKLSEAAQGYRI